MKKQCKKINFTDLLRNEDVMFSAINADDAARFEGYYGWFGNTLVEMETHQIYGRLKTIYSPSQMKRFSTEYDTEYGYHLKDSFALFTLDVDRIFNEERIMTNRQLSQCVGKYGFYKNTRYAYTIHSSFDFDKRLIDEPVSSDIRICHFNSNEWVVPTKEIFNSDFKN